MEYKTEDLRMVALGMAMSYPGQKITERDIIAEANRLHLGKPLRRDNNE